MKSILKLGLVSAISLFLALPAFSADVTMRISLQLPLKSHLGQNLLVFKDQVESKSGGAIVVEIYDSAQLYKDKEVPAAVGSGSIEAGVASLTRYVSKHAFSKLEILPTKRYLLRYVFIVFL